jgi:hypothetical protein
MSRAQDLNLCHVMFVLLKREYLLTFLQISESTQSRLAQAARCRAGCKVPYRMKYIVRRVFHQLKRPVSTVVEQHLVERIAIKIADDDFRVIASGVT